MKLYLCHWRFLHEVVALVAALTRGQAKATLYRHIHDIFAGAKYVDIYAQRSELADEHAYLAGELTPSLVHFSGGSRGEWQ